MIKLKLTSQVEIVCTTGGGMGKGGDRFRVNSKDIRTRLIATFKCFY